MIRQELHRHRIAYSVLVAGLFIFGVLIFGAWPNTLAQRLLAGGLALFYFIWGVTTHVKSTTITVRVIFEYAVVATLAGGLLWSMTY